MIGNPKWFTYRIFGWGVRPKTKEGWIYIVAALGLILTIALLPISQEYKVYATLVVIAILVIDTVHIMIRLDEHHDEREKLHQLIIERNCSFAAIVALVCVAIYQSIKNAGSANPIDANILFVLIFMVVVKAISTLYVKWKM